MAITAVAHISQVRGGSQARIMLGDDGKRYVVKLQGNPQCTRVLANDYLACRMARMIGLNRAGAGRCPSRREDNPGAANRLHPGWPRGSSALGIAVWFCPSDWRGLGLAVRIDARAHQESSGFAGVLAFDKWTGNARWPPGRMSIKRCARGNTPRRSSILVTASMQASGVFTMLRCEECTGSMMSMSGSDHGMTLNHGCRGSRVFSEQQLQQHCGRDPMRMVRRAR